MTVDPALPIDKSKLAYNLEEAAAATGYSASTLRIAIRRHDLLARYANTKPIILADELQEWLRSLPTEPKGGHQPLSDLEEDVKGWPGSQEGPQRTAAQYDEPQHTSTPPAKALFRTPEDVAPELGISKSALRQYCKASGIHTRVGKNKIMIHADDVPRLVDWIREEKANAENWATETERDPFA